jgi:hypothetical protein
MNFSQKFFKNFSIFLLLSIFGSSFVFFFNAKFVSIDSIYNQKKSVPLKTITERSVSLGRSPAFCDPSERGLNVVIEEGEIAYLDESTNIDTLTINGELHCDEARAAQSVELRVKTIYVNGTFQCGTTQSPYKKKMIISLKDSGMNPSIHHGHRGIIVNNGGKLNLNGERKNAGWYKLAQTIEPGDQSLFIDQAIPRAETTKSLYPMMPWKVGDQIVVGPTGFNYLEAEKFTIVAISNQYPYEISLDHPAEFKHYGENQIIQSRVLGNFNLDERAEVANLSRRIVIRADEADGAIDEGIDEMSQIGGHIMVHFGGKSYIDSIELYKMGQAGIMGRYPFHWHWAFDVNGQYIKNSSIHHSYQRCITVHRTHSALVQNNVCYDFKGHGYFLEDGNEINNKIIGNLAMRALAPSSNKLLLASDNILQSESQGRFPSVSGFWISNPKNIVTNNVVSGSIGTGFWMSFENQVKDMQGNIVAKPIEENTLEFNYNTAHATKVGITWDGAPGWESANNPNNPDDKKIVSAHYQPSVMPTFTGLKTYKNLLTGIYFRGDTVIFKNSVVADNGWSYWVSYNQIIKDSVFIGRTNNNGPLVDDFFYAKSYSSGRQFKTGIVIYDGPFEIHHSDFLDYSTEHETYNSVDNSTIIPITLTGGTNKFANVTSGLYFNPNPIYRAYIQDSDETPKARQGLGNATIRDLDGTLAGNNQHSLLVGTRSLSVKAETNCQEAGDLLHNFKICPGSHTEGSFTFMRWSHGPIYVSPWWTPFIVKRDDGAINYLKSEWSLFPNFANNLFAVPNNQNSSFEILPYYQYEIDRSLQANAHIDVNYEVQNPNSPVVKIIAYGNNCRLEDGAIQATSLAHLKLQTQTSYFTQGPDFYVRVIPKTKWDAMDMSTISQATAFTTMPIRHRIVCDPGYLNKIVKGNIDKVVRGKTQTTITGWACNFTHAASIKVKLFAYGRSVTDPTDPRSFFTYIKEVNSNLASDPSVAFKCGKLSTTGRNFSFTLTNSEITKYPDHKIFVQAISNTGGNHDYIDGSGVYSIQRKIVIEAPVSR